VTQIGSPSSPTGLATTDTSRLTSRANLDKAGTQFEAVFTRMMLTSMRKTKLAEPLFDSKAIDTFRDMQDGLVAQAMADHAPMGIGKAVSDYLAQALPPPGESPAAPPTAAQPDLNETASPQTP
jgi:flagellar protein FlgJ